MEGELAPGRFGRGFISVLFYSKYFYMDLCATTVMLSSVRIANNGGCICAFFSVSRMEKGNVQF